MALQAQAEPSYVLLFFLCHLDHRDLHSFPTRRSSDLGAARRLAATAPALTATLTRIVSGVRSLAAAGMAPPDTHDRQPKGQQMALKLGDIAPDFEEIGRAHV